MASISGIALLRFPEPNPTPTANPSGILWRVMAMVNRMTAASRLSQRWLLPLASRASSP
jgi:hypothetical protein